ncbi:hypothetical protein Sjap_012422 [Stephania japonica]|uniref:Uncharacterized protein n=1 Tax=Stephania japonica TaxID=461633 RepID=A0AAP0IX53_9MAGN
MSNSLSGRGTIFMDLKTTQIILPPVAVFFILITLLSTLHHVSSSAPDLDTAVALDSLNDVSAMPELLYCTVGLGAVWGAFAKRIEGSVSAEVAKLLAIREGVQLVVSTNWQLAEPLTVREGVLIYRRRRGWVFGS